MHNRDDDKIERRRASDPPPNAPSDSRQDERASYQPSRGPQSSHRPEGDPVDGNPQQGSPGGEADEQSYQPDTDRWTDQHRGQDPRQSSSPNRHYSRQGQPGQGEFAGKEPKGDRPSDAGIADEVKKP